jgi:hypothetical protein
MKMKNEDDFIFFKNKFFSFTILLKMSSTKQDTKTSAVTRTESLVLMKNMVIFVIQNCLMFLKIYISFHSDSNFGFLHLLHERSLPRVLL